MRNIFIVLLMFFAFSVETSYVRDVVTQKAKEKLADFTSFNVVILQEPYGSSSISNNEITLNSIEIKPGLTIVNFKTKASGKAKTLKYIAKINVFDEVLFLKETVPAKREFDPSITEGRVIDVTALFDAGKKWVKSKDECKGQRFTRTVKKDSILLREVLQKSPDIKKNEVIKVNIKEGLVELTCDVIALEDGYVGQTITVINSQYKRKIQAVVKGLGALEIKG